MVETVFMLFLTVSEQKNKVRLISEISEFSYLALAMVVAVILNASLKVQTKCCFFIAEFERATKIRKIAVYRFLISHLVPEL